MHLVGGAHGSPSDRALRAYCVRLAAGGRPLPAAGKGGEPPGPVPPVETRLPRRRGRSFI